MPRRPRYQRTRLTFGGRVYRIYDAMPSKSLARSTAKGLRTLMGRAHPRNMTLARMVDLGKRAGRLRYAVYIAAGRRLPRSQWSG